MCGNGAITGMKGTQARQNPILSVPLWGPIVSDATEAGSTTRGTAAWP